MSPVLQLDVSARPIRVCHLHPDKAQCVGRRTPVPRLTLTDEMQNPLEGSAGIAADAALVAIVDVAAQTVRVALAIRIGRDGRESEHGGGLRDLRGGVRRDPTLSNAMVNVMINVAMRVNRLRFLAGESRK